MLGAGSLFTGGVVWYAWERVWIWRRLPLTDYAVDFRRSLRKADQFQDQLLRIWLNVGTSLENDSLCAVKVMM